jgi:hypothetical protein
MNLDYFQAKCVDSSESADCLTVLPSSYACLAAVGRMVDSRLTGVRRTSSALPTQGASHSLVRAERDRRSRRSR